MLKSTLLISLLMLSLLLSCGKKEENTSENTQEGTSAEEKPTKESKNEKQKWEGIYEYFDKNNNTNLVLTINKDNTYEITLIMYKGGFISNGTLETDGGEEASLIAEDVSAITPVDKEYKKGDTFAIISKNQQEPLDIDIECPAYGERTRLKKVDKAQDIKEGGF